MAALDAAQDEQGEGIKMILARSVDVGVGARQADDDRAGEA